MALCYLDSFEWCANDATLMATRWSGSSISTTVTTGRTGSNGLQLSQGSGTSMYRLLSSTQENATMIVGAAVNLKSASNSVLFTFRSDLGATLHLTVEISAVTGAIKVYRGNTGGTVLATASAVVSGGDKWQSFEAKAVLSATVGAVTVKWNGTQVISISSANTKNGGTKTVFDACGFQAGVGNTVLDDYRVISGDSTTPNDFIGDARVRAVYPTGSGSHTDLTASSGSNWSCVDEASPNQTDYVSGSSGSDTYAHTQIPSYGSIAGFQLGIYAEKSDTGARSVAPLLRISGTDYTGAAASLATSYSYSLQQYSQNPATTSAWVPSDINALEVGVGVS